MQIGDGAVRPRPAAIHTAELCDRRIRPFWPGRLPVGINNVRPNGAVGA